MLSLLGCGSKVDLDFYVIVFFELNFIASYIVKFYSYYLGVDFYTIILSKNL